MLKDIYLVMKTPWQRAPENIWSSSLQGEGHTEQENILVSKYFLKCKYRQFCKLKPLSLRKGVEK